MEDKPTIQPWSQSLVLHLLPYLVLSTSNASPVFLSMVSTPLLLCHVFVPTLPALFLFFTKSAKRFSLMHILPHNVGLKIFRTIPLWKLKNSFHILNMACKTHPHWPWLSLQASSFGLLPTLFILQIYKLSQIWHGSESSPLGGSRGMIKV